jgi:hypothetical protein
MMERPEAERLQTEHLDLRPAVVGPVDWEYRSSVGEPPYRTILSSATLSWSVWRSSGPIIGGVQVTLGKSVTTYTRDGVVTETDHFSADLSWEIDGDNEAQELASEAMVAIVAWLVGQGVTYFSAEVTPGDAATEVVARACGLRPVPSNASGGAIRWHRKAHGPVETELRRMAAGGATPYQIADRLWFGAARERPINWIKHMCDAFGMPLHVAKGVSTDPETMNRELAPWVHSDVFVGDDG